MNMQPETIEENGITYQRNSDGSYCPQFTETQKIERPLGKYGTLMRNHLRDHQPERFQKQIMDGSLWDFLHQTDEQSRMKYEQIVRRLQEQETANPANGDYLAAIQTSFRIETQADQIVRDELFPTSNN